ncbi:hypothetical protein [Ferrimonas pelagia]|uniref:Uncharacterized protein n=1 Tax=Ferrimonas pelagia TaxID=1177826 RepID=A0ABP9EBV8_9GAMM
MMLVRNVCMATTAAGLLLLGYYLSGQTSSLLTYGLYLAISAVVLSGVWDEFADEPQDSDGSC